MEASKFQSQPHCCSFFSVIQNLIYVIIIKDHVIVASPRPFLQYTQGVGLFIF